MAKRIDLMLCSYLNNNNNELKRQEATFEGDKCVYGSDYSDGFTDIYLSPLIKFYILNMYRFCV